MIKFESEPIARQRFLNAGRKPGAFTVEELPIHRGYVDRLPDELDALIVTADLQGREVPVRKPWSRPPRLLGEVIPDWLSEELLPSLGISAACSGAVLAGDFYTVPALNRRGGTGDVTQVWNRFADRFAWAVGVPGNHDLFGEKEKPRRGQLRRNAHYLDGEVVRLSGMRFGGVGGIIGNPRRPHRYTADEYLFQFELLLEQKPDVIICHDGPSHVETGGKGSHEVRELLEKHEASFCVRGHAHWQTPYVTIQTERQRQCDLLNVDCRLVILQPIDPPWST